jgi:hypothetical protein
LSAEQKSATKRRNSLPAAGVKTAWVPQELQELLFEIAARRVRRL